MRWNTAGRPCNHALGAASARFGDEVMEPKNHPDSHELHDLSMYGPKDPEIANLVDQLAYVHGLRVREIETIILRALNERLTSEKAKSSS